MQNDLFCDITFAMSTANRHDSNVGAAGFGAFVESMRVVHWVKNAFVAAPILFAGRIGDWRAWEECLMAVAAFCLLSSGIYMINDVLDLSADRAHPVKCRRAVASGRLKVAPACIGGAAFILGGLGIAAMMGVAGYDPGKPLMGMGAMVWPFIYVLLNVLYSVGLKNVPVVDVLIVSLGFVLRAMTGASAIGAAISPWLVVCTLCLCLFIALTKRRGELEVADTASGEASRSARTGYSAGEIDYMLAVSSAMAILTYTLYCLSPGTVSRVRSAHMVWTIPLVIYGIFRYSRISRRTSQGDPMRALVSDRAMWIVVGAYVLLTEAIFQYGHTGFFRDILDVGLLVK